MRPSSADPLRRPRLRLMLKANPGAKRGDLLHDRGNANHSWPAASLAGGAPCQGCDVGGSGDGRDRRGCCRSAAWRGPAQRPALMGVGMRFAAPHCRRLCGAINRRGQDEGQPFLTTPCSGFAAIATASWLHSLPTGQSNSCRSLNPYGRWSRRSAAGPDPCVDRQPPHIGPLIQLGGSQPPTSAGEKRILGGQEASSLRLASAASGMPFLQAAYRKRAGIRGTNICQRFGLPVAVGHCLGPGLSIIALNPTDRHERPEGLEQVPGGRSGGWGWQSGFSRTQVSRIRKDSDALTIQMSR